MKIQQYAKTYPFIIKEKLPHNAHVAENKHSKKYLSS